MWKSFEIDEVIATENNPVPWQYLYKPDKKQGSFLYVYVICQIVFRHTSFALHCWVLLLGTDIAIT